MNDVKIKLPLWLRIFYIISGVLSIGFALVVLINIKFGYVITALLLGIALITIGSTRILIGIFDKKLSKWLRIFNLVIGVLLFPVGIIAMVYQDITVEVVYVFIALALILLGIFGVVKGFEEKKKDNWYQLMLIVYGFIVITLGILVLVFDSVGDAALIAILASGFMLIGVRRLIEGSVGHMVTIKGEKVKA
ncbi:MAG: hypothetical protein FK732_04760 [Asgard group archaeon]|nr:hypothetical protein [Asgard group archaeon]